MVTWQVGLNLIEGSLELHAKGFPVVVHFINITCVN